MGRADSVTFWRLPREAWRRQGFRVSITFVAGLFFVFSGARAAAAQETVPEEVYETPVVSEEVYQEASPEEPVPPVPWTRPVLTIDRLGQTYTLKHLADDIGLLQAAYPELKVETLGKSFQGRDIPILAIGEGEKVLIVSACHGREWITTCLAIKMASEYLYAGRTGGVIDGINIADRLKTRQLWIIPAWNPDGVYISQTQKPLWKANARGVDLNRQFPVSWTWPRWIMKTGPSYMNWPGQKPLSEPESLAIANLMQREKFKYLIAYHSAGELLIWDTCMFRHPSRQKALACLSRIRGKTGYRVYVEPKQRDHPDNSLREYFIKITGCPGFTIEVARPCLAGKPIPTSEMPQIWKQNRVVPLIM